ncbi:MAG: cyclopropane-fatty-acyl-phospholipid synthase family protein [Pseudomonadota bacterium]
MCSKILTRALSKSIRSGRLTLELADGTTHEFGARKEGFPEIALRFTDKRVPWDIIKDADLGLAEAFMDGRMIIDHGDIMGFGELLRVNNRFEDMGGKLSSSLSSQIFIKFRFQWQQINNRIRSKKNVAHHYDVGNKLYALMLDPEHMQYSCGYWSRDDMTLGEAQEAKLAHIASKLALRSGQSVLDIGCGWGGMAIFLAKHFDVRVMGITLSEEQLSLARKKAETAGVADRVTFELTDYRDLADNKQRFDRIASIGMFEHVGRQHFDEFFECCAKLLNDDGAMLLHTIGRMGEPGLTDRFTSKYIFPGGYIPALSEAIGASQKVRLIATDVETLRIHYAKTIECWYENCVSNKHAIIDMFDERFFRMWTLYLAGAATVFRYGGMCNFQIQYVRERLALPLTRDYMFSAERRITSDVGQ